MPGKNNNGVNRGVKSAASRKLNRAEASSAMSPQSKARVKAEEEGKDPKALEKLKVSDVILEEIEVDYEKIKTPGYAKILKRNGGFDKKAIFEYCFQNNIFYHEEIVKDILRAREKGELSEDVDFAEEYKNRLAAKPECKGRTFFSQIRQHNFEKIYSTDLSLLTMSDDDKKNRLQCIDILSYDPFLTDDKDDRPQLYRDLASMLTDSMRKDVSKAKAALSIVRAYNNLEKYQRKINDIMQQGSVDDEAQKTLDQCIKIQKTLQDQINQTSEKNSFTVKGLGSSGHGTLSDVLNQIGEKGIDEGVTNFYDIQTSKSIEEIANISFKAQLNQVALSKTDYADILSSQAKLVRSCQMKAASAMEALRLAREKIVKQELLDELEADYRKKGISESEIQDFIAQEYKLYDALE